MFTLKRRKDSFRLILPKEFIPEEINEKYSKILQRSRSFYKKPIDFLNETIQKIEVLGFNDGTVNQQQTGRGEPLRDASRITENHLLRTMSDVNYRNVTNATQLIDKTFNIDFKHTLGHLNYFMIFESFIYQYARDTIQSRDLNYNFKIEILNENGSVYSSIVLAMPLINGIDMLQFDNSQPIAQSETFRVIFKYSNFDYEFIEFDDSVEPFSIDEHIEDTNYAGYPYTDLDNDNITKKPSLITTSPFSTAPGNIPYGPGGQIIYNDEGGVIKDLLDNSGLVSDLTVQNNIGGKTGLRENEKFLLYPYPKEYGKEPLPNLSGVYTTTKMNRRPTTLNEWRNIKGTKFVQRN